MDEVEAVVPYDEFGIEYAICRVYLTILISYLLLLESLFLQTLNGAVDSIFEKRVKYLNKYLIQG